MSMKTNLWRAQLPALQALILGVFLSIVAVDRGVVELIFKPLEALPQIRLYHFLFLNVLSTVVFASLGIAYALPKGQWRLGLAIFLEGIILTNLGMEDLLYFLLFGQSLPRILPWLNDNPFLIGTTVAAMGLNVTDSGLLLASFLSVLFIASIWIIVRKNLENR